MNRTPPVHSDSQVEDPEMFKKAIVGTAAVLVLGAILFGTGLVSYLRTSASYVSEAVQDTVPMSFQIDRAPGLIEDLVPEIRKNLHVIAKEQVEVERLEKQVAESKGALKKAEEGMVRLRD